MRLSSPRPSFASLVVALGVAACGGGPAAPPGPVAPRPVEPACTWETPLVPGVPGSPGHWLHSELNPNGQSELAALMRTMQRDLAAARADLSADRPVQPMHAVHARLRCAWPTDPSDRTAAYDAYAQGYLAAVARLESGPANPRAAYGAVLDACTACHASTCPGPIAAIDALRFPDALPAPAAPSR